MNVFGELVGAQLENVSGVPAVSASAPGRIFYRSDLLEPYIYDGVVVKRFLCNDQKIVIGTFGGATDVRLYRGGTAKLAVVLGNDTTAENSITSANLTEIAFALERFTTGARPAAAKGGRPIWNSTLAKPQVDTGAAWETILTDVGPRLADYAEFTQIATPSTPSAGFNRLYFKSDSIPYIKNSAGVETALLLAPTTAVTYQTFTGGGTSGTYTRPAGVVWIKVKMVGGGGGGASSGTANWVSGSNGTNSIFGTALLVAPLGNGATLKGVGGAGGAAATINSPAIGISFLGGDGASSQYNGTAGSVALAGGNGGSSIFGGAGRGGPFGAAVGLPGKAGTGGGGGGGSTNGTADSYSGSGGGAGAGLEAVINAPSASYTYTVGAGGAGGAAGTNGAAGRDGGDGIIIVEEHY
jgi:hypothetical protein